jgi:hypothetical protein
MSLGPVAAATPENRWRLTMAADIAACRLMEAAKRLVIRQKRWSGEGKGGVGEGLERLWCPGLLTRRAIEVVRRLLAVG